MRRWQVLTVVLSALGRDSAYGIVEILLRAGVDVERGDERVVVRFL